MSVSDVSLTSGCRSVNTMWCWLRSDLPPCSAPLMVKQSDRFWTAARRAPFDDADGCRCKDIEAFPPVLLHIQVWEVRTGKLKVDLPGHADEVFSVDWSPDGANVASGGKDKVIKLWRQ